MCLNANSCSARAQIEVQRAAPLRGRASFAAPAIRRAAQRRVLAALALFLSIGTAALGRNLPTAPSTAMSVTLLRLLLVLLLAACPSNAAIYGPRDDVKLLTAEEFEQRVVKSDEFWVIEWFANWCGGCNMVSPWYKEAATLLKPRGIQLGAMDMDLYGDLGRSYGVSGMPHIMAFLPGDPENPVGMGGLGGAETIVKFAEEQFAKLSEDQRNAALAATLPPPPPAPPSIKTVDFFASLGLEEFSAEFVKIGHETTASLSALDPSDFGELGM